MERSKILVVDDEKLVRRMIARVLESEGMSIVEASNGLDAVQLAKAYDGVLALGVTISTTTKLEPKFLKVKMYQGTNVVEPYYTKLNHAARRKMKVNSAAAGGVVTVNVWDDQYYIYFDLKKLDPKRTMVLAVTDEVGGTREYVLKLDKVN